MGHSARREENPAAPAGFLSPNPSRSNAPSKSASAPEFGFGNPRIILKSSQYPGLNPNVSKSFYRIHNPPFFRKISKILNSSETAPLIEL